MEDIFAGFKNQLKNNEIIVNRDAMFNLLNDTVN